MTTRPAPARLIARLAVAGTLALGLAGGVATVASAAPAPVDDGRIQVGSAKPGVVIGTGPGPTTTVPERPDRLVGPERPCDDDPEGCEPDPCDSKLGVLPQECRPDPCRKGGADPADRCPDPCEVEGDRATGPGPCRPDPCDRRRSHERPERCRPEPCADTDDQDSSDDDDKERGRPLAPRPEECPEPEGCDPSRCDRPVPGKPTFTG